MRLSLSFRSGMILAMFFHLLLVSCATQSKPSDWIMIGSTTKDEVVEEYGEPELTRLLPDGEIAAYRPDSDSKLRARVEVPVAQAAGISGAVTTGSHSIERGLGVRNLGKGNRPRPEREFRVHYDNTGIVTALEE